MSVRVVARIRPLLKQEIERDIIVTHDPSHSDCIVRIPNPKNDAEAYSFQFNSVYDSKATQQDLFEGEVAPNVKHLFKGFDVTIFAYGVTGTGKTHTMRGGKSLTYRGVIPRLLSAIYRRARKIEKETDGATKVSVVMSYYEIYTDRVYDLFESPEKRTPSGLPIRDNNGKSVVVGLTERPCSTLKDFEQLYDQANLNRSTSATKLNAHSSRSHAILCVKLIQTTGDETLISSASAIDLAGSEDNRRTENNKERMVESASINKSLFVLAQCVEAISKKQSRIPYRESKMTRILSLGQNNGITIMILNLAPVRSYHLDTLSSLNFANRTKKIEVNEIENEPIFRGPTTKSTAPLGGALNRQPLKSLTSATNARISDSSQNNRRDKPILKTFNVYTDKSRSFTNNTRPMPISTNKRPLDSQIAISTTTRPTKLSRPTPTSISAALSRSDIENLINARVDAKLAEHALTAQHSSTSTSSSGGAPQPLDAAVQARLDALERRVSEKEQEDGAAAAEGLHFLLMAKQHQARGEIRSALHMLRLARPWFSADARMAEKLAAKIAALERRVAAHSGAVVVAGEMDGGEDGGEDGEYVPELGDEYDDGGDSDGDVYQVQEQRHARVPKPHAAKLKAKTPVFHDGPATPRTRQLLDIINSRNVSTIRGLKGVGTKKAEAIVASLMCIEGEGIADLEALGALKGVGWKTVENMRSGLMPITIGDIDF